MDGQKRRSLKMAALMSAMAVSSLVVGFVIGYFVIPASANQKVIIIKQENQITAEKFVEMLNVTNIEENVRYSPNNLVIFLAMCSLLTDVIYVRWQR